MKKLYIILLILSGLFLTSNENNQEQQLTYSDQESNSLRSSGAVGGYEVNSPFNLSYRQSSYISSTGYLYAAGYNVKCEFGNNSTSTVTTHIRLYKNGNEDNPFRYPRDWSFTWYHGIVIDEDGTAWHSGANYQGVFGQGTSSSSSTSPTSRSFIEIANIGTDTYNAISTDSGYYHSVVMLDDQSIWCAGQGSSFGKSGTISTYTKLEMPEGKENSKIRDYAGGYTATWVLFEDGDLYTTDTVSNPWVKVASNIAFFDVDGSSSYVYAVTNDNEILYGAETKTDQLVEIAPTLNGEPLDIDTLEDVVQVRAGGYNTGASWGFLTKDGDLYTAVESSTGNGDLSKVEASNVRYFDMGSSKDASVTVYGYLDSYAQMYLWGDNGNGQLATGNTSDLSDPSHSESSVIIPSLEADFSGLYSIAPQIKKSTTNEALPADELYMTWSDEGYLYVDYSNYSWSDLEQKIEVAISDINGVVTTFTLDKNKQFDKDANYPTKYGLYTIQSQLLTKVNGVWELDGSVNTTIFQIKLNDTLTFNINEENLTNDLGIVTLYDNCDSTYDRLLSTIQESIKKGDIKFDEDLYTFDEVYEKYELSLSDFDIKIYKGTSTTPTTSITTTGTYKVGISFKGLEGYYDVVETTFNFTLESKEVINSNEILFNNNQTSIIYFNEGNDYSININNNLFDNEKYSMLINITGDNFDVTFDYKTQNILSNMPKNVGEYIVTIILSEETQYGTIIYKDVKTTLTINKDTIEFNDISNDIKISLEEIGIQNNKDVTQDLIDSLDKHLNDIISNDLVYVLNNLFTTLPVDNQLIKYTFYDGSQEVDTITNGSTYKVVVSINEIDNYICTQTMEISFLIIERITLEDNNATFNNNKNNITFNNSKYSILIDNANAFNEDYTLTINITDNNGFNVSYLYGDDTWELMPKMNGEYLVEVVLVDNTIVGKEFTSYSYTTLEVLKQTNKINVSNELKETFKNFIVNDNDILNEVLKSVSLSDLELENDVYIITRESGKDSAVLLNPTITNFTIEVYQENKITELTKEGNYTLKILFNDGNDNTNDLSLEMDFFVEDTAKSSAPAIIALSLVGLITLVIIFLKKR